MNFSVNNEEEEEEEEDRLIKEVTKYPTLCSQPTPWTNLN